MDCEVRPDLVRVSQLRIGARSTGRLLVDGVDLQLTAGETLGILGESGSGKTLTLRSLIGGLSPRQFDVDGDLNVLGDTIYGAQRRLPHRQCGRSVAMIYQDPSSALDPLGRIGSQMVEAVRAHQRVDADAARGIAMRALSQVQFIDPERIFRAHPHELSGGQKQRVAVAMALLHAPRLLLADEPTTALDLSTQAQVLRTLKALQAANGMAIVLVTHDVGVVAEMADRVLVMRNGQVVEHGTADEVLCRPRHPYTRALLDAKAGLITSLGQGAR